MQHAIMTTYFEGSPVSGGIVRIHTGGLLSLCVDMKYGGLCGFCGGEDGEGAVGDFSSMPEVKGIADGWRGLT